MKPVNLVLRCYAEKGRDGTWFAMCIDLNLYAREDSLHAVRSKLHGFLLDYVREACTVNSDFIADLIPRRAPMYFWARYYWLVLRSKIDVAAKKRTFNEALPLVPA